ncbi:hypothetical protein CMQ_1198 [Grosmannia clavigera kw1407]|uniref:Uncharacterized protein n=1 Tax=Grosmannia clavigera (strain kw1407 / UAMH 11150) TaxID=655863 RepID=F0XD54_GROCL|nr:uncharacterized protein CMQ_1198 [Grosmannia clavigera kw1407]EFX04270.1 hypothetical protein CMQ_1198 [Grosmannia clavigera kw1407]
MPKQYVLFGRLLPPITTRRITVLLTAVFIFAVFSVIFTLPSAVPTGPSLSKFADHKFSLPQFGGQSNAWSSALHPFRPKSHAPPSLDSESHKGSSWSSHWSWLTTPFSSSYTLDEDRALLPPLPERPPIYCYYDATLERDKAKRDAESALLLTWRRAWWAQGFRPIILSSGEAINNPRYEQLQHLKVTPAAKADIMRWLAWENMGGGLLAQYLVLPMGARDDALLTFLRRGEYPILTRWEGFGNGLFAGSKADIAGAIKLVLDNPLLVNSESFLEAIPAVDTPKAESPKLKTVEDDYKQPTKDFPFRVDSTPTSLAFYEAQTVAMKYTKVGDSISQNWGEGMLKLNQLINSHLHVTWQNTFSSGIAVLKPKSEYMTQIVEPALGLANRLVQCSATPLESSCPPNFLTCNPCVAKSPMPVHTPPTYRNVSTLFTIGTVPHPYTYQSVAHKQGSLDVKWVRRKSQRDVWLFDITKELLGTGVSSARRVLRFKEAVAGQYARAHTLWFAAEQPVPEDVDWRFGFVVPRLGEGLDKGESQTPVPGPERLPPPKHDKDDGPIATPERLVIERDLLAKAKQMTDSKDQKSKSIRDAVEAWNIGDMEAWKFARAYLARADAERTAWEKEEAKYAGGVGSEKGRRDGHFWGY